MKFIDTHAHIYNGNFSSDIFDVIARSIDQGVERIYMPNIDHTTIDDMLELEHQFPDVCIPMMGLHPCSVKKDFQRELYIIEEWLNKRKFVAIGEIGTDLYWDKRFWNEQAEAFKTQSMWAIAHDLPISIHSRESIEETIDLLGLFDQQKLKGILHCFTGSLEQAEKILEQNFLIGVGGVCTFKNGGLENMIEQVPLDKIVLETDSPYLAPVPYRGKRNEPSFIPLIASRVAELKKIDAGEVAAKTTANANTLFSFKE